jgi:phage-related protein
MGMAETAGDEGTPVYWIGRSREDLRDFPRDVQREVGFALWSAQLGEKHSSAKPLKGFSGGGVLEVVENQLGDTYRCVYVVRFTEAVYVLHAFQKKSKSGIKTPKHEVDLIKSRLKLAENKHKQWLKEKKDEIQSKEQGED